MSCIEIYGFDTKGNAYKAGEIHNAWRGAMAIWRYLENTYLPPFVPSYVKSLYYYHPGITAEELEKHLKYKPSRLHGTIDADDKNAVNDIWNLAYNDDISDNDRTVLLTTFDKILVKKENIPDVIRAFRNFGDPDTSLPEQAEILQRLFDNPDCIAVGWNQNSICADSWGNFNHIENGECLPYNCLRQNEHVWLEFTEDEEKTTDE